MTDPPASREQHAVGRHVVADLYEVDALRLKDGPAILACLRAALEAIGLHVLDVSEHSFSEGGEGYTGILLLAESHASVHTYPEFGYLAADVFSCGPADPAPAIDALVELLRPGRVEQQNVPRGASLLPR